MTSDTTWCVGSIDELTPAILTKSDNVAEIGKLPITDPASADRYNLISRDASFARMSYVLVFTAIQFIIRVNLSGLTYSS